MQTSTVLSRAEIDEPTLLEIAETCNVPTEQIEDIYACTPLQLEMLAGTRAEVFQIVLSCGTEADIDLFCEALRQVISQNSILRTRFVKCHLGIVQVVTRGDHVTERRSGDIEEFLRDEEAHSFRWGRPTFRSTFVDNKFVATVDHAVVDYWSLTTIFTEDVVVAGLGLTPNPHRPFKDFVAHCMNIDEAAAKSFWSSRFQGTPAIFPKVEPGLVPCASQRETRKIALKRIGQGVPITHVPAFIEAAWALTSSNYAGSDSIAYGFVLSGRSFALNGIETTLGPTIAEVPVQVNLQRNMTIERLIKDRAASQRQLRTHPALHYGLPRIGAVSEAARIARNFQSLLNIRPSMVISAGVTNSSINHERLIWPAGPFCLDLICSLLDDGILVNARSDPKIISGSQLHQVLNRFERTLQRLTEVSLQTNLEDLQL